MKILIIHAVNIFDAVGGSEVQLMYISDYLIGCGHEVIFYSMEFTPNKSDMEKIADYRVYHNNHIEDSLFMPWKHVRRIEQIIDLEKPKIMFARCMRTTFLSHLVSRKTCIPFVYQLPLSFTFDWFSIKQLLRNIRKFRFNFVNAYLAPRYLGKTSKVLAICRDDAKALSHYFGIEAKVIYNMHPVPDCKENKRTPSQIVWINNIKPLKRPEMFIELAKRCVDMKVEFIMAGSMPMGKYGKQISDMISNTSNLKYLGQIPFEQSNHLLDSASINVVTSTLEGFGNSNIQGWLRYVPVVTTIDRDAVVTKNNLGFKVHQIDELEEKVRFLLNNPSELKAMGKRARQYAVENHSYKNNGAKYEKLFLDLIEKSK